MDSIINYYSSKTLSQLNTSLEKYKAYAQSIGSQCNKERCDINKLYNCLVEAKIFHTNANLADGQLKKEFNYIENYTPQLSNNQCLTGLDSDSETSVNSISSNDENKRNLKTTSVAFSVTGGNSVKQVYCKVILLHTIVKYVQVLQSLISTRSNLVSDIKQLRFILNTSNTRLLVVVHVVYNLCFYIKQNSKLKHLTPNIPNINAEMATITQHMIKLRTYITTIIIVHNLHVKASIINSINLPEQDFIEEMNVARAIYQKNKRELYNHLLHVIVVYHLYKYIKNPTFDAGVPGVIPVLNKESFLKQIEDCQTLLVEENLI